MPAVLFALPCLILAEPAAWQQASWQARAVVEIAELAADEDVDTAAVRVLCQGRCRPDGADFRVVDEAGQTVPFQVTFIAPEKYALLSFRAGRPAAGAKFYVYFQNPDAARAAEQTTGGEEIGGGPPQGAWIPKYGLVLATRERPRRDDAGHDGDNPQNVDELKQLFAASTLPHGARYQRQVSEGYNPFGSSDYYLSAYRGWIRIPQAGTYRFCTASNEASFSFLDGKELVHWPGRHTADRGQFGEKNASVELTAGLHYLEYYHEEVLLKQTAFLGWSPPGARKDQFLPIPVEIFTAPHAARVVAYETPTGPLPAFEPTIVDSIWPSARHAGQYTRVKFAAAPGLPAGAELAWDFGDGQTGAGQSAEHVYLAPGRYPTTLTVKNAGSELKVAWPLDVFEIQEVTEKFGQGRPADYADLALNYDVGRLPPAQFKELLHLVSEAGRNADVEKLGKLFLERHAAAEPKLVPSVQRLLAFAALAQGEAGLDAAVAAFQGSLTAETPLAERFDALARLIVLLGVDRNQPEKALPLVAAIDETVKNSVLDEDAQAAYRRAVIASGDVLLWHDKREDARGFYKRAEVLRGQKIPPQVKAARVGAFPQGIRAHLAAKNYDAALALVDEWEETFPTDKVQGHTLYWRGKGLAAQGQQHEAARFLAKSIALAPGAPFESEARWLLAEAYAATDRKQEARRELAALVALGLKDPFTAQARERLKTPRD